MMDNEKIVEAGVSAYAAWAGYDWALMHETDDTAHGPSRVGLRTQYRAAIDAHIVALAAAGLAVVPREPTKEMIEAGRDLMPGEPPEDYYAAMIAAAPDQC